jgi:Kdo2-lipid IVA lauroyltransferase/acyltransferase
VTLTPRLAALRNIPLHWVVSLLICIVRRLPEQRAMRLGRLLGMLGWRIAWTWRKTALRNIQLFYMHTPEPQRPTPAEMRRIGSEAAINLGYYVIELIRLGTVPLEECLAMVVETEGLEHVHAALAQGSGLIALGIHYGSWDTAGSYLSTHIKTLHATSKPQRDSFFTRLVSSWRERSNVRLINPLEKFNSVTLRVLKDNEILGLIADINGGQRGIFVPFCGIPASTVAGPAALALKTGAPMILMYCRRLSPGRLRFIAKPPVDMTGLPTDRRAALLEVATRVNAAYEACIREDPTQWLWGHKRWKTRPPGEPGLY